MQASHLGWELEILGNTFQTYFHKLFSLHTVQLLHLYFMHIDIYCLIIYRAGYTCYKAMWCSHLIYFGRITFCHRIYCSHGPSKYLIALETSESIFLWRVLNYVNFPWWDAKVSAIWICSNWVEVEKSCMRLPSHKKLMYVNLTRYSSRTSASLIWATQIKYL